jgi:hypothetical protein
MKVEIINTPFRLDVHGYSGAALNKDYVGTAFGLMDKMWKSVKGNSLKNKGLNIWIYEPKEMVFAGVELEETVRQEIGLELKTIVLDRYAYYKHIGPYNRIKETGQAMHDYLKGKGFETSLPYIEIYGHWTKDETKLETELLMCLK